jgi:hypothetical protein
MQFIKPVASSQIKCVVLTTQWHTDKLFITYYNPMGECMATEIIRDHVVYVKMFGIQYHTSSKTPHPNHYHKQYL